MNERSLQSSLTKMISPEDDVDHFNYTYNRVSSGNMNLYVI